MTPIRFIAGSGRSGTTWIQDALAAANGLRPVFEPLHPYLSDIGGRYAHRAMSADEEHAELKAFLTGSLCRARAAPVDAISAAASVAVPAAGQSSGAGRTQDGPSGTGPSS